MPSIAKKISKFTQREIDTLFKHARRIVRNEFCTILYAPRQADFGRVLIIASRRVGNAPQRNLLRRRTKAIFYEEKLYDQPFDWVVIMQKRANHLSFDQLKTIILDARQKAMEIHESTSAQ